MVYSASAPVVEWSITPDCKFGAFGLRWFESNPAHSNKKNRLLPVFFIACSRIRSRVAMVGKNPTGFSISEICGTVHAHDASRRLAVEEGTTCTAGLYFSIDLYAKINLSQTCQC